MITYIWIIMYELYKEQSILTQGSVIVDYKTQLKSILSNRKREISIINAIRLSIHATLKIKTY